MLFHWFINRKTLSIITKIKCSHFDKIDSGRDTHTHTHTHTHTEEYYSARKTEICSVCYNVDRLREYFA